MNDVGYTGRVLGGRYAVGELLGKGGWGAVYAGSQTDLGRKVAIKVLHGDMILAREGLARFVREARSAAALGHPNIAQVSDFQANPGEPPFIVMEHLSGRTLGDVLRREQRLPPQRVCTIAHQVLSALDVAHRAGIVHRDVKPDNIFLVSASMPGIDDFVKLLDFGIAKLTSENTSQLTDAGSMLGSPAFMAPEQVRNVGIDHRADLYALGATMYFAISGRLPIDAPSVSALLYAILEQRPTPLAALDPQIDPRLSSIIDRAMHKDAAGRFASAAEMRAAIEPWASGRSPATPPSIHSAPPTEPSLLTTGSPAMAPTLPGPPPHSGMPVTPAPAPSRGSAVIVLLVAILVLLLLLGGGGGVAFYLSRHPATSSSAAPAAPSSAAPGATSVATPSPPSPIAPTASATATATQSAAPKIRAQMTGTSPATYSGSYRRPFKSSDGKTAIALVMPAIKACHVSTEFDPPNHEFTEWKLTIEPAGNVSAVSRQLWHRAGWPADAFHPKHDACMTAAFRQSKWPATPEGGSVTINIAARTREHADVGP